jgi:hypothetical protein
MKYLIFNKIMICILSFSLYVQLSPTMGNIWIRNSGTDEWYFTFAGLLSLILYPLKEIYMWYPSMWTINFFMWLSISFIIL